jgi:hypothetical protein
VKGVIFNLLEQVVTEHHGADTWDSLLDAAGVSGAYTSLGTYPDTEMGALVTAASTALGIGEEAVLFWFGTVAIPQLAARYPAFFDSHGSTEGFLQSLNTIIHPEVRKLYPGAVCPHFGITVDETGTLRMIYRSPRRLCALAEGFLMGAAKHYGETIEVAQDTCMHRGDACCTFQVKRRRTALACTAARA